MELTNPATERALLGCILFDNRLLDECRVTDSLFSDALNLRTWGEIKKAIARGNRADLVEMRLRMPDEAAFVAGLTDCGSLVNGAQYYADLQELAKKRAFYDMAKGVANRVKDEAKSGELADYCEKCLTDISEHSEEGYKHVSEFIPSVIGEIEKAHALRGELSGIPTGFEKLDAMTNGWQPEYYVIGARPSTGKTALALCSASKALDSSRPGGLPYRVGFFSSEMSGESLVKRNVSDRSSVDHSRIRSGFFATGDMEAIHDAFGQLVEKGLYICDTPNITKTQLISEARKMRRKEKVDIIFIDYIGLISNEKKDLPRHEQIADISRSLKGLARELKIPIVALSQVTRDAEGKRPTMANIRESGCLSGDTIVRCQKGNAQMRTLDTDTGFGVYSHIAGNGSVNMEARKCFSTGKKKTSTMVLSTGHEIRATDNHRFLTVGEKWKRLDELSKGDLVGLSIKEIDSGEKTMNDDDLKFLGLFIGNGCALPRRSIQYTGNVLDIDLSEEIKQLSNIVCDNQLRPFIKHEIFRKGTDKQSQASVVYFPSIRVPARGFHNPLIAYLSRFGLWGKRAKEKTIPVEVFSQPIESRRLFLKYLWAADGTICYSEGIKNRVLISYSTSNKDMARQVQLLLQSVGVLSSIVETKQRAFTWYNVSIYSRYFKKLFMDEIGIAGKRKGDILNFCREKNNKVDAGWTKYELSKDGTICYIPIKDIIPYGIDDVYDIEVPESHNFIANGFIVHNSIEQDSDGIMFLWDNGPNDGSGDVQKITLIVAKQRNGPTGDIPLLFYKNKMRFKQAEVERWD